MLRVIGPKTITVAAGSVGGTQAGNAERPVRSAAEREGRCAAMSASTSSLRLPMRATARGEHVARRDPALDGCSLVRRALAERSNEREVALCAVALSGLRPSQASIRLRRCEPFRLRVLLTVP